MFRFMTVVFFFLIAQLGSAQEKDDTRDWKKKFDENMRRLEEIQQQEKQWRVVANDVMTYLLGQDWYKKLYESWKTEEHRSLLEGLDRLGKNPLLQKDVAVARKMLLERKEESVPSKHLLLGSLLREQRVIEALSLLPSEQQAELQALILVFKIRRNVP